MPEPWLSVVLPTWNGQAYLAETLESVVREGVDDLDVVAVDDGSTDRTLEILRSYASRLPLRILEPGRVGNWVANTNRGMAQARGTHVSILHQDDSWRPGRLRRMREASAASPGATLIVHASVYVDSRGRRVGLYRPPLPRRMGGAPPSVVVPRLLVQNFLTVPSAIFPRQAFLEAGGMDESLWYTADWDLWIRLAGAGRTVYVDRPLASYRIHPLSQTSVRSFDSHEFRAQHEEVLERHLGAWSGASGRAARFSIEVNTALAALANRRLPDLPRLAAGALGLGPAGLARYWTVSRIAERAAARLRCRLWSPPARYTSAGRRISS